jgi:RNA polymerase sigma-70 factor, ECF subfamily
MTLNVETTLDEQSMVNEILIETNMEEDDTVFQVRFTRCRKLLYFIAVRVLGGPEQAEDAIENCQRTASRNPPRFEHESAFRSWLLRVLIDEALAIRRKNQETIERITAVARNPLLGIVPDHVADAAPGVRFGK